MGFRWRLLDLSGAPLRDTEEFASREEAEAWLAAEWQRLLDDGAESVVLREDDASVYEMGLREA